MSRPRNNLDELQRKHALPAASSPTKLTTPQTAASKVRPSFHTLFSHNVTSPSQGKFKPAKSIPTSTPAAATGAHFSSQPPFINLLHVYSSVKRLGSWSTPGFGKNKPLPLKLPSAADNSLSYIDVSSTESILPNASTSSIPTKRLSSGCPEDLFPAISPKRPKTDRLLDKENVPYSDPKGKGKARARDPTRSSGSIRAPPPHTTLLETRTHVYPSSQFPKSISSLRVAFEAVPPDADLVEVQIIKSLAP